MGIDLFLLISLCVLRAQDSGAVLTPRSVLARAETENNHKQMTPCSVSPRGLNSIHVHVRVH